MHQRPATPSRDHRTGLPRQLRHRLRPPGPLRGMPAPPAVPAPPKVRHITSWIRRRPDSLDTDEQLQLTDVLAACPHLEALHRHVKAFAEMMTGRHGERLDTWIAAARADDLPHLHTFANGLERDHAAVLNGLTLPYSSVPSKATSAKSRPSSEADTGAPNSTSPERSSSARNRPASPSVTAPHRNRQTQLYGADPRALRDAAPTTATGIANPPYDVLFIVVGAKSGHRTTGWVHNSRDFPRHRDPGGAEHDQGARAKQATGNASACGRRRPGITLPGRDISGAPSVDSRSSSSRLNGGNPRLPLAGAAKFSPASAVSHCMVRKGGRVSSRGSVYRSPAYVASAGAAQPDHRTVTSAGPGGHAGDRLWDGRTLAG